MNFRKPMSLVFSAVLAAGVLSGLAGSANAVDASSLTVSPSEYVLPGDDISTIDFDTTLVEINADGKTSKAREEVIAANDAPTETLLPGDDITTIDLPGEWVEMPKEEAQEGVITPFITTQTCGSRVDWYRIVNTSGTAYCYRNAGYMASSHLNIRSICPGANQGRAKIQYSGELHWTKLRGPLPASQHTLCYQWEGGAKHTVKGIEIK